MKRDRIEGILGRMALGDAEAVEAFDKERVRYGDALDMEGLESITAGLLALTDPEAHKEFLSLRGDYEAQMAFMERRLHAENARCHDEDMLEVLVRVPGPAVLSEGLSGEDGCDE